MFYDTKRKYHKWYIFHFYIYLLLALSSRTFRIISCLSYEYILSVSYNCFLVNMTYIRSILYIYTLIYLTLYKHTMYEVSYMIWFVSFSFFFECIDIYKYIIYIYYYILYILHVHICLMKMRSMHISLGVDHCIDYLQ